MSKIRFSLSLTSNMNTLLVHIATIRGTAKNKIINEACWRYVEEFEEKHGEINLDKEMKK